MLSKRKGRSRGFNKKRGNAGANPVATAVDQDASKEGEAARSSKKRNGGGEGGRKSSSSNSDNGSKSGIRTRRRRRRRMKARQMQEGYAEVRKSKGHWRRKPRKSVSTTKESVGCSESSWSGSHLPMSSTTPHSSNVTDTKHVPTKVHYSSNLFRDAYFSHVSKIDCFKLPWANLDVPMDLSHIKLEVKNRDGIDFELLAEKNHQRWCANLMKAQAE